MSEPICVSPLLDGFVFGAPISEHHGIRCYPAMKQDSDKKYIVKEISLPASQTALEALLLTRAYKDAKDAVAYFQAIAQDTAQDAGLLEALSGLDGFIAFEGCQIVPMENNALGFRVYLLGQYRRSLERFSRRHAVTHLEAVNLGLDLCNALSVCRRAGKIYVDLKPSNIFLSPEKEYRIGDLGFLSLDSLKYAAMPERFMSPYTAPEVRDVMATMNDTVDIYAAGMILYELYNGGVLPEVVPGEALPKPAYADEEISEIILKACAPKPEDRWPSPIEMGQALVGYMQRNVINDTPIAPPPSEEPAPAPVPPAEKTEAVNPESSAPDDVPKAQDEAQPESAAREKIPSPDSSDEPAQDVSHQDDIGDDFKIEPPPPALKDLRSTETWAIPPEPAEDSQDTPKEPDSLSRELEEVSSLLGDNPAPPRDTPVPAAGNRKPPKKKKQGAWKKVLTTVLLVLLLVFVSLTGFSFYRYYYLQTISSLTLSGTQEALTVTVDTDADPSILSVTCTDAYGSVMRSDVVDGKAVFSDLQPDSLYKIQLEVSGFHKLVGQTSDVFTTDPVTEVAGISAITGSESGSVLLNITISGREPEEWTVTCSAEGEENIVSVFTGHSATVKGLTVGKEYTIALSCQDGTLLSGELETTFVASALVLAQNPEVVSHADGELTVRWDAPEIPVETWTVKCYGGGYEQTQEVTQCQATFTGVNTETPYTVEITAADMTQPARLSVTANPITVTAFHGEEDWSEGSLTVSWEFDGVAPEGGWLLMYAVDGAITQNLEKCSGPSLTISPAVPGATYSFIITSPDDVTVFKDQQSYTTGEPEVFMDHALTAYKITAKTLPTPEGDDWRADDVLGTDYTSDFTAGQHISLVLHASVAFYLDNADTTVLYVIRDGDGNVVSSLTAQETLNWKDLWSPGDYHDCELDLPKLPATAGSYTAEIYFNWQLAASADFTVS